MPWMVPRAESGGDVVLAYWRSPGVVELPGRNRCRCPCRRLSPSVTSSRGVDWSARPSAAHASRRRSRAVMRLVSLCQLRRARLRARSRARVCAVWVVVAVVGVSRVLTAGCLARRKQPPMMSRGRERCCTAVAWSLNARLRARSGCEEGFVGSEDFRCQTCGAGGFVKCIDRVQSKGR